jgi:hypothetical protein
MDVLYLGMKVSSFATTSTYGLSPVPERNSMIISYSYRYYSSGE